MPELSYDEIEALKRKSPKDMTLAEIVFVQGLRIEALERAARGWSGPDRRERITTAAMPAVQADYAARGDGNRDSLADETVRLADAIINRLTRRTT